MRRAALLTVAGLVLLPVWRGLDGPLAAPQNRVEQSDRETRPLSIDATGTVNISNISGDITIVAGAGPASVEIIRRGHARTAAEAKAALATVTVTVDVQSNSARIQPVYPRRSGRTSSDVSVSFVVTVPAGVRTSTHAISGDIKVTGMQGGIDADTASGDITLTGVRRVSDVHTLAGSIRVTDSSLEDAMTADSVAGDIVLTRVKVVRITATSTSGDIVARNVQCDQALIKSIAGSIVFAGPLAANGRYDLHTQSGGVRFSPTGEIGYMLDVRTFSGDIHTARSMPLVTTAREPHSLTGTVGKGDATVRIVTFSGTVSIGSN